MPIQYVVGDATQPQGDGEKLIVHIVNPIGAWGAGFVLAVSARWPHVKAAYQQRVSNSGGNVPLGRFQIVQAEPGIFVVNLFGQLAPGTARPIRYDAVYDGLTELARYMHEWHPGASVHMPKIGAGLARGEWSIIAPIVEHTLQGIPVTVYTLPA